MHETVIELQLTQNITHYFIDHIWFRYHPLVFNILSNYCHLCNLGIYKINSKIKCIKCKHINF